MDTVWQSTLKILEPDYLSLKDRMENGPKIIPLIEKNKKYTTLTLIPKFELQYEDTRNLDVIVQLASKELENWKSAKRIAWNIWTFKDHSQAEKFVTLFYVKWPQ